MFFLIPLQLTSSDDIGSELVCDHFRKKVHWIYLFVSSKFTEKLLIHGRTFEIFGPNTEPAENVDIWPNIRACRTFGRPLVCQYTIVYIKARDEVKITEK